MWADYEAASCYGREVATLGGPRGASRAYFAPSLSAVQLLLPSSEAAALDFAGPPRRVYSVAPRGRAAAAAAAARLNPNPVSNPDSSLKAAGGGAGGRAVPLLELFEAERPFERPVLGERVTALAAGRCAGGALPGRRLLEQPLAGLHPASWCVRLTRQQAHEASQAMPSQPELLQAHRGTWPSSGMSESMLLKVPSLVMLSSDTSSVASADLGA